MINSALILKGQAKWPDGDKLKRHGIKRLFYEAIDPVLNAPYLKQLRDWGYAAGVMWDPIWRDYTDTPQAWVEMINAQIAELVPVDPATKKRPPLPVMLDIERHDPAWVLSALAAFKQSNPGRNVCWTVEYHQAGWFTPGLVELINNYPQLVVAVQCYHGDMDAVDTQAALRDLVRHGVYDQRVAFFYSTRVPVPADWDGVLYIENWSLLP